MATIKHEKWEELRLLFPKYLSGDNKAIEEIFSAIQKVLQGYFYTRTYSKEDADDLAQLTLLKIHFARDRYNQEQSLKTWVFTIASRALIDHWRKTDGDPLEFQDSCENEKIFAKKESEMISPELKTLLQTDLNKALKTLKPIERQIVYLYGVEEMSMAEIALVLRISESAVKLRAHRAYKELRAILISFLFVLIVLNKGDAIWTLFNLLKKI